MCMCVWVCAVYLLLSLYGRSFVVCCFFLLVLGLFRHTPLEECDGKGRQTQILWLAMKNECERNKCEQMEKKERERHSNIVYCTLLFTSTFHSTLKFTVEMLHTSAMYVWTSLKFTANNYGYSLFLWFVIVYSRCVGIRIVLPNMIHIFWDKIFHRWNWFFVPFLNYLDHC